MAATGFSAGNPARTGAGDTLEGSGVVAGGFEALEPPNEVGATAGADCSFSKAAAADIAADTSLVKEPERW